MDEKEKEVQLTQFVLERTKPGQEAAMSELIDKVLAKRREGKLSTMFLMGIVPQAMGMIKPEAMDEIKTTLKQYR
ncbi:hypothetical protein ACFQ5M_07070 [Agrilactobacillus yilanensis]|uniref:Glutamyl-tRNA amidotransferase n=1 Tax=Agrilactobacillus yilanensis TaxID=2485997 RepID=A0ABW4J7C2_9LACO|nr:hypothetical protein [Agrilactobacillus yilanensis]